MNRRWKNIIGNRGTGIGRIGIAVVAVLLVSAPLFADSFFTVGNLVVSVEGDGSGTGSYGDNQAAPLTLYQYNPTSGTSGPATLVNTLELPQTTSGANFAVSGEYGSSSEGTLQLSGNGQYLTIAGYGINANTFNTDPGAYSPDSTNTALGQSGSMTGQSYTPVPRVVALIDANGTVDSSTAVYNVFNANNPRSAYTQNGSTVYISGQGTKGDATGGVFLVNAGAVTTNPTSITGTDGGSGSSQDTRDVQLVNGTLYVSTDSKDGSTNRSYLGTLGTAGTPPTGVANGGNGPTMLAGFGNTGGTGKETITAATTNGVNSPGQQINLSPESYFFANADTLYVTDSGDGKQTSATSTLGDGGLQKWTYNTTTNMWVLDYTLSAGLNLVPNTDADGTSGLLGLTGEDVDVNGMEEVELFATNYTLSDLDQTYLYGITDILSATTEPGGVGGESFSELAAAPADTTFKGVSFAPNAVATPEPGSLALAAFGMTSLLLIRRRRVSL